MRINKLFITALLFSIYSFSAEKYGLIIAIGEYPAKTGWSSISSVNDVPLIKQSLLNQNFKESNITTLINEQATKKGILDAIHAVKAKLKEGDILVIHYSGHGQQIFDDNGDEIDSKDESIVPYDAFVRYTHNYKGENHLRDDELANIIASVRNLLGKDGQFLFLLDSCHSGSATRGGKTRGGEATFAPDNWKPSKNENPNGSDMVEAVTLNTENTAPFVMISGASANELNYEYEGFGSLSFAYSKAMNELGSDFTYRQLFSKIAAKMNVISPKQNPTIEGDIDYKLFKGEYVTQQKYYPLKKILRSDVIKIQAGKLQGLFKETTVNILPAGTIKVTPEAILAKGTVVLANYNQSNIKLDTPLKTDNSQDYWVFIDEKSYGDIALKVFLDNNTITSQTFKNEISSFLETNKLGEVVESSINSSVIISKTENNYTLNATNDWVEFSKNDASRGDNTITEIKQQLFNYSQGAYLKALALGNKKYEFSFRLLPIEYDVATEEYGKIQEPELLLKNNIFTVKPGVDNAVIEVTNHSTIPVYFSIIEINSKGEIATFMPNDNCTLNNNERLIPAGETMVFKDCLFSFGPPYEKLMLKGFASNTPINFESTVKTRGAGTRGSLNPLEQFLAKTYTQSRGGAASKVSGKIDGFSTEMIYEIVEE